MARTLAIAVLGGVALATLVAGAANAQDKCGGSKLKATGKKAAARWGCFSKAAAKALPVDSACLAKSSTSFSSAYGKAEAKGGCNTTGDAAAIEAKVDAFALDVNSELYTSGEDKCAGSKIKAAGKKASGILGCHSKAATKNTPIDAACTGKVEGKFTSAFGKAEAKGGCNTTGDAAAIEAKVDAFVVDVANELTPPPTTTTTLPSTPVCGDGVVSGTEQCDPPCGSGCSGGSICNSTCQCEVAAACACGAPTPTSLTFLTVAPGGTPSGSIAPAKCVGGSSPGTDCVTDGDCPGGGTCRGALQRGGLYFGGGVVGVPLPASIPDNGKSITKACCNGSNLILAATTAADTGSSNTCTSVGCNFGPPLPIPNAASPGLSTCVLNQIATNAVGSADCSTGAAAINLPLGSHIVLGGDMLPKRCTGTTDPNNVGRNCIGNPDCPGGTCVLDSTDIQSCPICNPTTLKCNGGASDPIGGASVSCTPGTLTTPGVEYPTSRDCLPSVQDLAILPIGFALTTDTVTRTATNLPGQPRVFCGFCFDPDLSSFSNPAVSCTGDADCASEGSFTQCRQLNSGAFGNSQATTITETGIPAGSLADHAAHDSMLVSVFCIPPTYSIVDGSAGLPGPGAASLPGTIQVTGSPSGAFLAF